MFKAFFSAPHRVMFALGALQSLLAVLFWAVDLGGRYAGLYAAPGWALPGIWLHGALMLFGLFPPFIFGFLMTALPKWVSAPALTRGQYLPAFALLAGGWLLFWGGLLAAPLAVSGLVVASIGWLWGLIALARAVTWPQPRGFAPDRSHAYALLAALGLGLVALWAYAWGLAAMAGDGVRAGIELGLWGCLLPVFFIVSHRMLPFFTAAVLKNYTIYRPMPLLWLVLACFLGHALLAMAGWRGALWLPDAVAAAVVIHFSWKWQLGRSLAVPMLAMIHGATVWLGLGLVLYTCQDLALALGGSFGGLAPLHAISIGYFVSMLLGMVTRVTLGHSGRPINAGDQTTWPLFWLFQSVPLLRIAGEFLPLSGPFNLQWLASLAWLLVFALWVRRHGAMYLRPRPDGQPG